MAFIPFFQCEIFYTFFSPSVYWYPLIYGICIYCLMMCLLNRVHYLFLWDKVVMLFAHCLSNCFPFVIHPLIHSVFPPMMCNKGLRPSRDFQMRKRKNYAYPHLKLIIIINDYSIEFLQSKTNHKKNRKEAKKENRWKGG